MKINGILKLINIILYLFFYYYFIIKGTIKTNTIINATGAWGNELLEPLDIHLPLVPMRHAYVISETIKEVQGMPNVRDHDFSLYFRIQGRVTTLY